MKAETGSLVKLAHFETHRASVLPPHNGENVRKVPVMYLVGVAPGLAPMSTRGQTLHAVCHQTLREVRFGPKPDLIPMPNPVTQLCLGRCSFLDHAPDLIAQFRCILMAVYGHCMLHGGV